MKTRYPLTSFPNGWFRVAYSEELPVKGVQPLHYFGKNLVLFRTEDGVAHVMDAHCPHLGAHLGHGGRIIGNTVQCPFHGWCFNGDGQCVEIPYTKKIPAKAQLQPWTVREINGLIMVWYHSQKEAPSWEIPLLSEYNSSEWTPFRTVGKWRIRSHVQDINENGIDAAHFLAVHGIDSVDDRAFYANDSILNWSCHAKMSLPDEDGKSRVEVVNRLDFTYYGLGYLVERIYPGSEFQPEFINLNLNTPVDGEYVDDHLIISFKKSGSGFDNSDLEDMILQAIAIDAEKDLPILEHKVYQSSPVLCEDDGPIMQYRRWASQFYSPVPSNSKIPQYQS
ncbi:Rieske (2Fe-2S) region [Nostoc sp. NIES-4103]|nr:Rieske (2Fe-2S) region [Nostoc sp. NIES-4103]